MARFPFASALIGTVLFLGACSGDESDNPVITSEVTSFPSGAKADVIGDEVVAGTELCDLSLYKGLEGTKIETSNLPEQKNLRVFNVNDIVTRDYIPQRTNIVYDDKGTITQVYCG